MMSGGRQVKVEQWGLRVPKSRGEETRRQLLSEGKLDVLLKPRLEGDHIFFPVTTEENGLSRELFDAHEGRGSPLPRHDLIGGIAILQEHNAETAEKLLSSRPGIHTVVVPVTDVRGDYRTREFEVLAGIPTTKTTVHEYGNRFAVDLSLAYFSPRLATERKRVGDHVRGHEMVLDMFAGVGPYAVSLAKKARFIVACDINPSAVLLLKENCVANHTMNILAVLADSGDLSSIVPWEFDRIIMNLPLHAMTFLGEAFRLCREGGTIHFYCLTEKEGEYADEIARYPADDWKEHNVRSYSPGRWHAVYDIKVGKK